MYMNYYTVGPFGFIMCRPVSLYKDFLFNPSDCQWIVPGTVGVDD